MKRFLIILLVLVAGVGAYFWWTGTPVAPTLEHAKDEVQQGVHNAAEKIAEKTATMPATAP